MLVRFPAFDSQEKQSKGFGMGDFCSPFQRLQCACAGEGLMDRSSLCVEQEAKRENACTSNFPPHPAPASPPLFSHPSVGSAHIWTNSFPFPSLLSIWDSSLETASQTHQKHAFLVPKTPGMLAIKISHCSGRDRLCKVERIHTHTPLSHMSERSGINIEK